MFWPEKSHGQRKPASYIANMVTRNGHDLSSAHPPPPKSAKKKKKKLKPTDSSNYLYFDNRIKCSDFQLKTLSTE